MDVSSFEQDLRMEIIGENSLLLQFRRRRRRHHWLFFLPRSHALRLV